LPDERTSGKIVLEHLERTDPQRKLAANKVRLNCLLTELEELSIDAVDDNLLGGQLELTEALFRETDALQAEWEQDLEAGERKAAIEDWAKSRRRFLEARARAQGRLQPKQLNGPSCSEGCNSGNLRQTAAPTRIGKLTELTLPQFDGEVLKFPTFWAQFEASVHADTELDDATKFAYLLSNTTGRALGAIAGLPITAANYPQAVGILHKRFGRPKIVARAHLLALWKAPECREMTRQGIQTLVDEITKHLRCLAAMGKDHHAGELPWSEALMPGLKEKFPRELQRAWDLKVRSGPESEDNLKKFLEFAQLQADSLSPPDEFSPEASREEKGGEATRKELTSAERKGRDCVASSALALVTSVQRVCPFCEGDHDATGCQRFLNAGYSARMSMSREKGVCYKCLKTGHRARECRTSRPCGVDRCRQPHHQLLHPPATREPPRSPGPDQSHQSLLAARNTRGGGLQTIRARAYGPDGNQVVVNCLFDTGSQVSFIRKDVTEVLGLTGSHERCRFTTLGGRVGPVRRWRRVEFRLGAVESSGRPLTSTLIRAVAIPQVCGKVQPVPGERSKGAPAGTKLEMGQRREMPLMIDVLIGIDYYYEFVTGRIRRRATSGPVALETLLGWVVCGRTSPRRTAEVESFPTNPEHSAVTLLRKNGEIDEVEILPEEDVPEKNKEAREERIRVYRQHSVRRQSARSEHGDAEPAEGELHRIEVTRKQRMGKEDTNTPVSMSHTAVPSGRHEWTRTLNCHGDCGTRLTGAYQTPAVLERRVWIPAERTRRQDLCCGPPKSRKCKWPGCRCATPGLFTRGPPSWDKDWCCLQRLMATWWGHRRAKCHHGTLPPRWKRRSKEIRPTTNAPTWNRKENRRRVHRKPGVVAEPSTGRKEVDGMCRCPPVKPCEDEDNTCIPSARSLSRRLAAPSGVKETPVAAADDRLHSRQWLFTPLRQSQVKKYYEEAARWTGTPNDYREIKEAESIIA
ncbi:hypothetical protein T08_8299, partial [Trichinella sp. T8]